MYQTFYIDIDEEITSIVDRLRKARTQEVVIVVPKRAILIQSIINLKLLKKEADSLKKELVIVTQDKLGKMLIEKAGIIVEQKLDDVDGQEILENEDEEDDDLDYDMIDLGRLSEKKRLDGIGTDAYYQASRMSDTLEKEAFISSKDKALENEERKEEILTNRELVIDVGDDLRKQLPSFQKGIVKNGVYAPMDMIRNVEIMDEYEEDGFDNMQYSKVDRKKKADRDFFKQSDIEGKSEGFEVDTEKLNKAKRFFEEHKSIDVQRDEYKSINVGNGTWKYFFVFVLIVAVIISGAVAYVFLPKASINIFVKNKIQTIDAQIDGNVNASSIDAVNEIIPAKLVSVSSELTKNYSTTGTKNSSNQKSRGTITIYNEFSSSPQPLVATTRFESADKKIFRLVNGVTVPGMEKNGSEVKPGVIEAEVVADEAGDEYNIEATSFTIPGFKSSGSDKYSKIYAKSSRTMAGGGSNNQTVGAITDMDINSAKTKVAQELRPSMSEKIRNEFGSEYIVLDDAINIDDSSYTLSNSPGDMVSNFSITVKMKASAIAFRKSDMNNLLAGLLAKKGEVNMKVSESSIKLEFGKADANFKEGVIVIRVHASGNIVPDIDLDRIKQDILGKQEDELKAYLNSYSDIDRIEIGYWPSFISGKIPSYERQVEVILDSSEK